MDLEAIRQQEYERRRNTLLVGNTTNVLHAWAQGHPADDAMQSLKRAFERFAGDSGINLAGVFERMEDN